MAESNVRQVADLLNELFRRQGMRRSLRRAEAVLLWPRVVGAEVARFSTARALRDGVLIVDVSDSETALHLSMQRRRFLAAYRDTYGVTDVRDVRFQVGRLGRSRTDGDDEPVGGHERAEAQPDPQAVAALARDLDAMGLHPEVAAAALSAGRSLLAMRAERIALGHSVCPTCGAVHDGEIEPRPPREEELRARQPDHPDLPDRQLCLACRRAATQPRVVAAAREVALRPGAAASGLGEDERAVVKRLALRYLRSTLADLVPRALAEPGLHEHVVQAARRYVALTTDTAIDAISDDDMATLPAPVARYLGATRRSREDLP